MEDEIIWSKNKSRGVFITKLGNKAIMKENEEEKLQWWKVVWKLKNRAFYG